MVLRIECKCGATLKVASKQAGLILSCAGCGRPFRIPAEKFQAAAEKVKPASGPADPAIAAPPAPAPADAFAEPIPVELDIPLANLDTEIPDLDLSLAEPASAAAPPAVLVGVANAPTLGYACDPHSRKTAIPHQLVDDAIQGPRRGFWADAFGAFVYPFMSAGNVVCLAALLIVALLPLAIDYIVSALPFIITPFAILARMAAVGWLCAAYLSIVQDTAAGSDDMPSPLLQNGIVEDMLKPFFRFVGACAIVLLPAALFSIALAARLLPTSIGILIPVWIVIGVFLLPLSLLLFSFNAPGMMFRVDLVILTIVRTILPYLAIWLMLIITTLAYLLLSAPKVLARIGLQGMGIDLVGLGFLGYVISTLAQVYTSVVSMRIIGLYYLHFKRSFAIVME